MGIFEINILWCLGYIGLFIYQCFDSAKREKKYQKLVEKLIDKLSNQNEDKKDNE